MSEHIDFQESNSHCDSDLITSLLNGQLAGDDEATLEQHLSGCAKCQQKLDEGSSLDLRSKVKTYLRTDDIVDEFSVSLEHKPGEGAVIAQVLQMLSPTDDPAMLGRIGGYEVSGVVGSGGMGVVLKAHDPSLDRVVAIKVMSPHLASNGSARKRFARESKAAAAVLHPNVIAIHGVSNGESLPYLVMPYVRGQSLQKRIDTEGPLPIKDILRIGSQVAAGLSAAHRQGLVHRDIKPSNIMLEDGVERVAITDFGLARAVDDASMTRSGMIAGTPQYMSPEQARAESIDQRSDVFSLGSVLYAMCTGHSPFRGETSYGVLRLISDKEPRPIREINPDIPAWLCELISRLHSKDSANRLDAEEVNRLLETCLAHVQNPTQAKLPGCLVAVQPPRSISAGVRWGLAGLVVIGLVLGVIWAAQMNNGRLVIECSSGEVPLRITQGEKLVERLTVTKDGATLAIAAGKYRVEIDGQHPEFVIDNNTVILSRGSTELVRIAHVQKEASDYLAGESVSSFSEPFVSAGAPNDGQSFAPNQTGIKEAVNRIIDEHKAIDFAMVKFRLTTTDGNDRTVKKYQVLLDGSRRRAICKAYDAFDELQSHDSTLLTPEFNHYKDLLTGHEQRSERDPNEPVGWNGVSSIPDIRKFGLVSWFPESVDGRPFDQHLRTKGKPSIEVEMKDGAKVIVVKSESGPEKLGRTNEYWLSSDLGFRPVYIKYTGRSASDEKLVTVVQQMDWRKYTGVWFPEKIMLEYQSSDSVHKTSLLETTQADFRDFLFPTDAFAPSSLALDGEIRIARASSTSFGKEVNDASKLTTANLFDGAWDVDLHSPQQEKRSGFASFRAGVGMIASTDDETEPLRFRFDVRPKNGRLLLDLYASTGGADGGPSTWEGIVELSGEARVLCFAQKAQVDIHGRPKSCQDADPGIFYKVVLKRKTSSAKTDNASDEPIDQKYRFTTKSGVRILESSPDGKRIAMVMDPPDWVVENNAWASWEPAIQLIDVEQLKQSGKARLSSSGGPLRNHLVHSIQPLSREYSLFRSEAYWHLSIQSVAFSSNGKLLAVSSNAGHIVIIDAHGKRIRLLDTRGIRIDAATSPKPGIDLPEGFVAPEVKSMAFSPDSRSLVVSGGNLLKPATDPGIENVNSFGALTLWDVATGKQTRDLAGNAVRRYFPECVAFSPDGKTVAGSGRWFTKDDKKDSHAILLWDITSGGEPEILEAFVGKYAQSMAFSPDGRSIVINAAHDMTSTGQQVSTTSLLSIGGDDLRWHCNHANPGGLVRNPVVQFSGDGKLVYVLQPGGGMQHIDVTTGRIIKNVSSPTKISWHRFATLPNRTVVVGGVSTDEKTGARIGTIELLGDFGKTWGAVPVSGPGQSPMLRGREPAAQHARDKRETPPSTDGTNAEWILLTPNSTINAPPRR